MKMPTAIPFFAIATLALALCPFQIALVAANLEVADSIESTQTMEALRPNIVLIMCDDLGYADVGFNGAKDIKTPRLDALAKAGTICSSAYVAHPFCGPSRMGLMAGQYPHKFGAPYNLPNNGKGLKEYNKLGIPASEKLLSSALQEAGYFTGAIGKWHMGTEAEFHPNNRGFDEYYGFLGGGHMYFPEKFGPIFERQSRSGKKFINDYCRPLEHNGEQVKETEYITDALSREAARFVKHAARKEDRPFFLYLAYNAPHSPLEAKEEDLKHYAHIKNEKRRNYAGMVHAVDRGVGEVIDALIASDVLENTLIVFLSDNGGKLSLGANNGPLKEGKGSVSEGGFRVPMFWHWPSHVPAETRFDHPVSSLDFYPTFASLAGAKLRNESKLDGKNIWDDFLVGNNPRPRDTIFALRHQKGYSVVAARQNDWKACRNSKQSWQLFNIAEDISEQNDLAEQYPERLKELVADAKEWATAHSAPQFFDSKKVADQWDSFNMPNHEETFSMVGVEPKAQPKNTSPPKSKSETVGSDSNTSDSTALYFEDFSTAPTYIGARGPNDNNISSISFGVPGSKAPMAKFGEYGGTSQYFADTKIEASIENGMFAIGSNINVYQKSRNRSYMTFIDTSKASVGQYNVSFDVSDFQSAGDHTSIYLHIYEGRKSNTGRLDFQVTQQTMLPKLVSSTPIIKGQGAMIDRILLDNEIEADGRFSLNFGIREAGENGDFLALVWSQVKRSGNSVMPSMAIDNVKVELLPTYKVDSDENTDQSNFMPLVVPGKGVTGKWKLLTEVSDEFNADDINVQKWNTNPESYGAMSWDEKNVSLDSGNLQLKLVHEPHVRSNTKLFYKSGVVRSHKQMTSGYFEARIKGCDLFPGACPAFWMFSDGRKYDGEVRYCEIDIVELQMNQLDHETGKRHPVDFLDMNLHLRMVDEDADKAGTLKWLRPDSHPELCANSWTAPWDPRDDFHVYGCEVNSTSITWFVDGEKVATKPNKYWHLPMNIALTLELRHPHIGWEGQNIFPVPAAATSEGFPTTMEVDYVRVWEHE